MSLPDQSVPDLLPRAALVLNAGSRRGARAAAQVERLLRAAGWPDLSVHAAPSGSELGAALDAAIAEGPDLLVVGGGDGTIGAAAARVAGTGTVLGVLPLGTANDFARTLGVPDALPAVVAELVAGKIADVDLGRVEDARGTRSFLNVASIGLSVGVTQQLSPRLKRRLGPLAYPVATLAAYRGFVGFTARLEFPDGDHDDLVLDDLLHLGVGSGRHYGGGNTVAPAASVDDQLLDVNAIVRGRLRDHVSIARVLKDGTFVEHEQVTSVTTSTVRVVTDEPMPVNLDGEIAAVTPATFTVEHNAVHVVLPRSSSAAILDRGLGRDEHGDVRLE